MRRFLAICACMLAVFALTENPLSPAEKPEWLESPVGISEEVPPPWTKVGVEGSSVRVWGRKYTFGPNGLPSAILVSGEDLLASPVAMRLALNGKEIDAKKIEALRGSLRRELVKDNRVVLKSEGGAAGRAAVESTVTIEYDGLMLFDIRIKPSKTPVTLSRLNLEIPIKKELATLFSHHLIDSGNPYKTDSENDFGGGAIPPGGWASPFTPLVWIGNERVGLQWFSEDMKGWRAGNRQGVVKIKRQAEATVLEVSVVDTPVELKEEFAFRFGLIATPVRPLPSYEKYSEFSTAQAASARQALNWLEGSPAALDRAVEKGLRMVVIHQMWTELQGYPGTFRKENEKALKEFVREAHKRGLKVILYLGKEVSMAAPEWASFGQKMIIKPDKRGKRRDDPPAKALRPDANKYYADFLLYKLKGLILDYDIDGVMLDGHGGVAPCANEMHGHGYRDYEGRLHPTYPVLETREMLKRIYFLFHGGVKKDGIVLAHVSSPFAPPLAFSDFRWAGEGVVKKFRRGYWKGKENKEKPRKVLGFDEFRAIYMHHQYGVPTIYMLKQDKHPIPVDETASMALVHDVMPRFAWPGVSDKKADARLWEVWRIRRDFLAPGKAEFYPYWIEQKNVRIGGGDGLKVSFFRKKGGETLFFLANEEREEKTASLDFGAGDVSYRILGGQSGISGQSPVRVVVKPKNYEVLLVNGLAR